jgi:hypothetical protein
VNQAPLILHRQLSGLLKQGLYGTHFLFLSFGSVLDPCDGATKIRALVGWQDSPPAIYTFSGAGQRVWDMRVRSIVLD